MPHRPAPAATRRSFLPKKSTPLDRSFTSSVSNAVSRTPVHFACSFTVHGFVSAACNNLLNSGNLNEHDKKIYCVPCHRRQFGPRGVGRGLGASSSMTTDTPPSSPSLNRVETTTDGHRHHRKTSTGSSPSRTSSDDDSRHVQPLTTHRTSACPLTVVNNRPSPSTLTNASSFRVVAAPATICPRCSKTVYSAEEVKAVGKSFHKRCYTCAHCKGSINAGRYSEHEGELYDNSKLQISW